MISVSLSLHQQEVPSFKSIKQLSLMACSHSPSVSLILLLPCISNFGCLTEHGDYRWWLRLPVLGEDHMHYSRQEVGGEEANFKGSLEISIQDGEFTANRKLVNS